MHCRLSVASNVPAAWRRRGIHCGLDESGSGCLTLKCRTSNAPACAKPPVACWHGFIAENLLSFTKCKALNHSFSALKLFQIFFDHLCMEHILYLEHNYIPFPINRLILGVPILQMVFCSL